MATTPNPLDFSFVSGGPTFRLLTRAHLCDDGLRLLTRRILLSVLLTWLPLLALSALGGRLRDGGVTVSFARDIEAHIRFLVVVPLLLAAEITVHQRLIGLGRTFLERGLVPTAGRARFDAAVASAVRLRDSVVVEVALLVLVYAASASILWQRYEALHASTWYVTAAAGSSRLTPAGMWYAWFSLPVFQFLVLRWYYRLWIWVRFLWQVSRIELALVPTHPDAVAGLGFLAESVSAFSLLLLAHGAMLAAMIANRIFLVGATLPAFKPEIIAVTVVLIAVVIGPLAVFTPQLARVKRRGLEEYGSFAQRYVRDFDGKWLRGGAPQGEALIGSADIQSLADLGNSFEKVRAMRLLPCTHRELVQLAAAVLLPLVPLALTMMSVEELIKKLVGLVL